MKQTLSDLIAYGVEGVSIDRIAKAAEVNKTSVYRRFGTREALITAALKRIAIDASAKIADMGSLRRELAVIAEHVAMLLSTPLGRSLARATLADESQSEIAAFGVRELEQPRAAAIELVERARARGEWRDEISPEVVLGAVVGALMHRALLERMPLDAAFIRQVVDLVAAGCSRSTAS